MSLEFVYGPASCHHELALVEKAKDWLVEDENHEVFYLVPNHIKFETEVSVLKNLHQLPPFNKEDTMASTRLQVFSFTRLAWYYLQNTKVYQEEKISEAGSHMLIRKVLLDNEAQLTIFKGETTKPGFISQLADLFNELQNGKIEEVDFENLIQNLGHSSKEEDFKRKASEFYLLYQAYILELGVRQVGITQQITYLAEYLKEKDLSNVMIVISGFSRFTAREQELIQVLVTQAERVIINLVLDKPYLEEYPSKLNMFFDAGKIYYDFYNFARRSKVKIMTDTRLVSDKNDFEKLDTIWCASQTLSSKLGPVTLESDRIQLWAASNPVTELTAVAKEIKRLVIAGEARYKEIEILTREMDAYKFIIAPIFDRYDIPYYLNTELEMTHHPLVEFLTSLFDINRRQFRYADIMRFLRTELFVPVLEQSSSVEYWQKSRREYRKKVDLTENVVLAYGYEGWYWTQEKDWEYISYDFRDESVKVDKNVVIQETSNDVRRNVREQLVPFFDKLKKAKTGREAATLLYSFLQTSGVESELLFWRQQAIEQGDLETAKIHEQTWQALMNLLDDYVTILGDETFQLDDFVVILKTGLEGLTYSKVPTTIDQVSLASLDLIHAQKNKVTFIIGASDQSFPQKVENKTLLSDYERELMTENLPEDKYLAKQTQRDSAKEPYIAYLAFHSAKDRLYLSYPKASERVKESKISPYLGIISKYLNLKPIPKVALPEVEQFEPNEILSNRQLLSDLIAMNRLAEEKELTMASEWQLLEQNLKNSDEYGLLARKLFESLTHLNVPETLTPELVTALYGDTVYGSVSKIESFNQCQYKYFMTYGLNLRERDKFELSPAATGDFYHDTLDQLFKTLIRRGLTLSDLTQSELKAVSDEVLEGILGESKFSILSASPRMAYIRHQLSRTIERVGQTLRRQSQRTGLSTLQTEVLFGQAMAQESLSSLTFDLGNDKHLALRGKIDRLDAVEVAETTYLSVVDYKSSKHSFDYRDVYFGLAMQMITYLDVAMRNAAKLVGKEAVKPAGAFYLQVKNPVVEGSLGEELAEEELLKEFGYQGLLLDDEKLLSQMDRTLEEKTKSSVYPFGMKKDGSYTSKQFASEEEINLLMTHNEENFRKAGEEIFAGEVKLDPAYRGKERVACKYCPFRSVCQFDVLLKENSYNKIPSMTKKEVLQKMKEKAEGGLCDAEPTN
ncbi:PD-(D/E)XK nuclease family protein [Vagococcus fessus]|uniref:ATP-dependent helicase/deoxyribonuclease subunit B n=1 Tax=Vagococcus fessus TaxID=120370 RepID=A0A430ABP4_9ENTE|nr:PD-(D/E)XK nuclease family protein [Vagococcus fessus]RSU04568.1 hypothetical protein CBF31_00710 [Vagococcus fessus]